VLPYFFLRFLFPLSRDTYPLPRSNVQALGTGFHQDYPSVSGKDIFEGKFNNSDVYKKIAFFGSLKSHFVKFLEKYLNSIYLHIARGKKWQQVWYLETQ